MKKKIQEHIQSRFNQNRKNIYFFQRADEIPSSKSILNNVKNFNSIYLGK